MNGQPPFQADTKQKTMEMVMHGRFQSYPFWTHHHKDLQFKLLKRDRCKRLGYGTDDYKAIISHKFFMKIDMDKLYNRQIKPPYQPNTKNELDKSGFDEKFTSMPIAETPMDQEVNQVKKAIQDGVLKPKDYSDVFDGFSYVDPGVMESFVPGSFLGNQSYLGRSLKAGSIARSLNFQKIHAQNQAQTIQAQANQAQIIQKITPQQQITQDFAGLSTKDLPSTTQANHPVDLSQNRYPTQPPIPQQNYPQVHPQIGQYQQSGLWVPFPSSQSQIPQPVFNQNSYVQQVSPPLANANFNQLGQGDRNQQLSQTTAPMTIHQQNFVRVQQPGVPQPHQYGHMNQSTNNQHHQNNQQS